MSLEPRNRSDTLNAIIISAYLLVWPLVVAVVLGVIVAAFGKEWRAARKAGRPLM